MATMPAPDAANSLPLFYQSLTPVSSLAHADYGVTRRDNWSFAARAHIIPLTTDEFGPAQRHYPIVFGPGAGSAPLALMSLTEGVNLFVGAHGQWRDDIYLPAFVRRYPFMLAKLTPEAQELSLCFDDASAMVTPEAEDKLFAGVEPSEMTKGVLQFCEELEAAVARTRGFIDELDKHELLIDGEITIQREGGEPAIYRGFRMVAEDRLLALRGDQLRKLMQSGALGLIFAHLLSLTQMSVIFERQQAMLAAVANL